MPSSLCHSPAGKPTQDSSHLCCQIQACLPCVQALQTNQPSVCSPLHGSSALAKLSCLPFLTFVKTFSACAHVSIAFLILELSPRVWPVHSIHLPAKPASARLHQNPFSPRQLFHELLGARGLMSSYIHNKV